MRESGYITNERLSYAGMKKLLSIVLAKSVLRYVNQTGTSSPCIRIDIQRNSFL